MVYAMGSGQQQQYRMPGEKKDPYQQADPLAESTTRLTPPVVAPTAASAGTAGVTSTSATGVNNPRAQALNGQIIVNAGSAAPGTIDTILRSSTPRTATTINRATGAPYTGTNPSEIPGVSFSGGGENKVSQADYLAEYYADVMNDPAKKMWLGRRAVLLGFAAYDPKSPYFVSPQDLAAGGVYQMWKWAGDTVMMNATLNKLTPEQYINSMYGQSGGDSGLDAYVKEVNAPRVSTSTSIHYASINPEAAGAQADQVAMQNLGRMASDKEMASAGGTLNAMLKASPSRSTTTTTTDAQGNSTSSTSGTEGMSASDAVAAYEAKVRRSSEGMAYHVGTAMEQAMSLLDRGL